MPSVSYNWTFKLGSVLFLIGIIGILIQFIFALEWATTKLDQLLPAETTALIHINVPQNSFGGMEPDTNQQNSQASWDDWVNQDFRAQYGFEILPQIEAWHKSDIALVWLEEGEKIWLLNYSNQKKVKKFLENFLISGESLQWEENSNFLIATPAFSSDLFFGLKDGWLIIAPSQKSLKKILEKQRPLAENSGFKKIRTDLPKDGTFFIFLDTQKSLNHITLSESWKAYKPLLQTASVMMPYISAVWETPKDEEAILTSKILTHEKIYENRLIPKKSQKSFKNIPHLALSTPEDVFLFMNGNNFFAKYQQTKSFLQQLDPSLSAVFEGIIQGESQRLFGSRFNFEKEVLPHLTMDYAFSLNFPKNLHTKRSEKNAPKNFYFTFLLDNPTEKPKSPLEVVLQKIRTKQQKNSQPIVQSITLPDGTIREELVLSKPSNLIVNSKIQQNKAYQSDSEGRYFYGFLKSVFAFSNNEQGLKSIIEVQESRQKSLAQNEHFRSVIEYKLSPSQSYTFLNLNKLRYFLDFAKVSAQRVPQEPMELQKSFGKEFILQNFLSSLLSSRYENIIFSRKVFPQEVYLKGFWVEK